MAPAGLADEESFPDASGSQSGRKTSLSVNSLDILSVNQLLESVSNCFLLHNHFFLVSHITLSFEGIVSISVVDGKLL